MDTFILPLASLQPSQFYLSVSKLGHVLDTFDATRFGPLPVRTIGGNYTLTDGHHTAFVALLMGVSETRVWYDTDDMDWEAYERSVAECRTRGVRKLADLVGRLLTDRQYQEMWHGWCDEMHAQLEKERQSTKR